MAFASFLKERACRFYLGAREMAKWKTKQNKTLAAPLEDMAQFPEPTH